MFKATVAHAIERVGRRQEAMTRVRDDGDDFSDVWPGRRLREFYHPVFGVETFDRGLGTLLDVTVGEATGNLIVGENPPSDIEDSPG